MKIKVLFTGLALLVSVFCFSQSKELKQKVLDYQEQGLYKIENGNVVVSRVIDNVPGSKDEIYIKVKSFFTRNYKDAQSVIQTDDKEQGVIIGKGYYSKVKAWVYMLSHNTEINAYHILRVDIKDGRVRVICNTSDFEHILYDKPNSKPQSFPIVNYAPITDKRFIDKGKQTEAFINLINLMNGTIDSLEKAITEGMVGGENEDW